LRGGIQQIFDEYGTGKYWGGGEKKRRKGNERPLTMRTLPESFQVPTRYIHIGGRGVNKTHAKMGKWLICLRKTWVMKPGGVDRKLKLLSERMKKEGKDEKKKLIWGPICIVTRNSVTNPTPSWIPSKHFGGGGFGWFVVVSSKTSQNYDIPRKVSCQKAMRH